MIKNRMWKMTFPILLLSFGLIIGLTNCRVVRAQDTVTLTSWDWYGLRMELLEEKMKQYEGLNPGVKFETAVFPSAEYWKKVLISFAANTSPDMMQFHQDRLGLYKDLLEPFPEDLFPIEELREEYWAFHERYEFEEGKLYYLPQGMMCAMMWYNSELWQDAGLSEADYPKTWEDLREVAKKVTEYSPKGEIDIAGFAFNKRWDALFVDFNYQSGGWFFTEDGKATAWDTPEGLKAVNFLYELVYKDKVNSPDFLHHQEAFKTKRAVMDYNFTHFAGFLDTQTDIKYDVSVSPTPTGESLPARGRNANELFLAVVNSVGAQEKEEAFKFMKWLTGEDDFWIKINKLLGTLPAQKRLWLNPEVMENNPAVRILTEQIPYTIFCGEMVGEVYAELKRMEARIYSGMSPEEALRITSAEADKVLKERSSAWVAERLYSPPKE